MTIHVPSLPCRLLRRSLPVCGAFAQRMGAISFLKTSGPGPSSVRFNLLIIKGSKPGRDTPTPSLPCMLQSFRPSPRAAKVREGSSRWEQAVVPTGHIFLGLFNDCLVRNMGLFPYLIILFRPKTPLFLPLCRCPFGFCPLIGLERLTQCLPPVGNEIRWWAGGNRARFPLGTFFWAFCITNL